MAGWLVTLVRTPAPAQTHSLMRVSHAEMQVAVLTKEPLHGDRTCGKIGFSVPTRAELPEAQELTNSRSAQCIPLVHYHPLTAMWGLGIWTLRVVFSDNRDHYCFEAARLATTRWHSARGVVPEHHLPQQCEKIPQCQQLVLSLRRLSTTEVRPALVLLASARAMRLKTQPADEAGTPVHLTTATSYPAATHELSMQSELFAAAASMVNFPQQMILQSILLESAHTRFNEFELKNWIIYVPKAFKAIGPKASSTL